MELPLHHNPPDDIGACYMTCRERDRMRHNAALPFLVDWFLCGKVQDHFFCSIEIEMAFKLRLVKKNAKHTFYTIF